MRVSMEDNFLIKDNVDQSRESFEDERYTQTVEQKQAELLEHEPQANTLSVLDSPAIQEDSEITREQLSLRKRILNWRTIVPLVIVVIFLVFFIQKANIDPQETWQTIRSANVLFLLAGFVVYYLSFPLRALRWRILLQNVGFTKANGVYLPKFWKLVEIIYISFFANVIVPAKLGDLYRAYLLRQNTGVSATRSFGTVLAERLLDLIVLLMLCIPAIIISLHGKLPWEVELSLEVTLAAVFVGVAGLFVLRLLRKKIEKLVPLRFRGYYNHLQEGMLGSFQRLPSLTVLSIGVWMCEALRFFFVAFALNLFTGDLLHVIAAAFFIGLVEALLTVIPFTGGGVGLVETGMAAMIVLLNPSTLTTGKSLAAAAILLDRTISLFSIIIIGFVVFMIAFGRQTRQATRQPEPSKSLTQK
jgi:glycosyltransferase 2 family protein